ncbi:protein translocase subunit SecF [Rothia sp. AR01]|uniref:Protein-export membrane protein SecF n=1 Tax=Rothia santali TaxID=2949643 RepID=A0A9X2KIU1_9MICC|nr:protein translocase subunit SecF [Rothia santali]MCP3427252.1 protein translocase subunit SecF [Rothia santali]
MFRFAQLGSNLYTGRTSVPFIPRRRLWLSISALLVVLSLIAPLLVGGLKLGIDFRGGSEFTVSNTASTDIQTGEDAVAQNTDAEQTVVTNIAANTVRVQTEQLDDDETLALRDALQQAYDVGPDDVTSTFVGPTWGQGVTRQALWGLVVFVALATVGMALYFRTVKMSLSAIAGLLFTVITTVGIYALSRFEVTPSAIIGFLTILSYSLYDSVVVFDKIRENTQDLAHNDRRTFAQEVNLAVNQTLVRSINTSVVGILPVGAILFVGAMLLGAGTLQDLSLALFIGIIMGTLGTLFVSAPIYAVLRQREPAIREQAERLERGDVPPAPADDDAGQDPPARSRRREEDDAEVQPVPRMDPSGRDRPDSGAVV